MPFENGFVTPPDPTEGREEYGQDEAEDYGEPGELEPNQPSDYGQEGAEGGEEGDEGGSE